MCNFFFHNQLDLEPFLGAFARRSTTMRTFISRAKEQREIRIAIRKTSTYMRAHADTMDSSCTTNLCLLFRGWYLHFEKRQLLPRSGGRGGVLEIVGKGLRGMKGDGSKRESGEKEGGMPRGGSGSATTLGG